MMTNPHTPIAATKAIGVVLAGGQSSRMGTDKAALRIGDESLLLRAQRILNAAGCNQILLSGHPRADWQGETIPDLLSGAGPVGGIVSALRWASVHNTSNTSLIFVPVDAPLLTAALLSTMLLNGQLYDGCLITDTPLPLVLRPTTMVIHRCDVATAGLLAGESWSVRRFIEPLKLSSTGLGDVMRHQLVNINTPTEWEGLLRELENCS